MKTGMEVMGRGTNIIYLSLHVNMVLNVQRNHKVY